MEPPYTPVVLTLTVEAPAVSRSTRTIEYHCTGCIARLGAELDPAARPDLF